jgi:uncharacterized alkaline shock family protein YloU
MAMTPDVSAVPDDDLDGHTMEELGDYLDRGRNPFDPSIENSAACRLALANMARLRELSWTALTRESEREPARDDAWIAGLLETIKAEIKPGRDIPLAHPDPALRLALTEAAVLGIVRRAGDTMGGIVMGRCLLDGDVATPGEPVRVDVTATVEYGRPLDSSAEQLRRRIGAELATQTELNVVQIDVTIDDVYPREGGRP